MPVDPQYNVADNSSWLQVPAVTPPPASAKKLGIAGAQQNVGRVWARWRGRLGKFFAGQLAVQLLAFVTGLLVLRWMSADEYAKTGVVLGFQSMFAAFVDLGIGGSLVALIGGRGDDSRVVGAYVAAARWWRRALLAVVLPAGAAAFYIINMRQGWSPQESAVLYACIAVSLYSSGVAAWASAPLLIHQRLGTLYAVSNAGSLARLAGCWLLHELEMLDAVSLTVLGTLVSAGTAVLYSRAAERHVQEPPHSDATTRLEVRRYVAPLVPVTVFYAVQGQLSTFLIAWFGQAQHIAEVTALGRLAQVFAFLSAIYGMIIAPYFARLPRALVPKVYTVVVIGTLTLAALISLAAFAFPAPLLWLIGPRYAYLGQEVGWVVLASAVAFAGGALWAIHMSLRWVFWWGTACYIGSVTLTQVALLPFVDLSSTLEVLRMGVATNGAALLTQAIVAWMGFRHFTAQRQSMST